MTPVSDPVHRRPTRQWLGLLTVVGVNLVLGVPAIVPVWLASVYLTQWPLDALGLTTREPTENDGFVVVLVVILPVVGFAVLAWFLLGLGLRRLVDLARTPWFWPVSALAVLAPSAVLMLDSLF